MVIISTSAVATIIHAVSAVLMVDVSAKAGDTGIRIARPEGATSRAPRDSAPMVFPQHDRFCVCTAGIIARRDRRKALYSPVRVLLARTGSQFARNALQRVAIG